METRVLDEILAHRALDGTHITYVLHDGGKGYGEDAYDSREQQIPVRVLGYSQDRTFGVHRQAHPCCF